MSDSHNDDPFSAPEPPPFEPQVPEAPQAPEAPPNPLTMESQGFEASHAGPPPAPIDVPIDPLLPSDPAASAVAAPV